MLQHSLNSAHSNINNNCFKDGIESLEAEAQVYIDDGTLAAVANMKVGSNK